MNESGESENSSGTSFFHLDPNVSGKSVIDCYEEETGTIFDNQYIRVTLIFLYSVVFCFCFFGNLAVVLVVTLHWKMRSITKFCLGNLAFANLCVGIFCIYQNLSTFLIDRWLFGHFMCKMYHFINSLSHTASILILVVICVERYLAILHPFKSRRWITITRLRIAIVTVWILSAVVCSPRLYYISIIYFPVTDSADGGRRYDAICAPQHSLYNAPLVDMSYFILLFILPLLVITVLYARIGIYVWKGSGILQNQILSKDQPKPNSVKQDSSSFSDSDSDSVDSRENQSQSYKLRRVSGGLSSKRKQGAGRSSSFHDAHSSGQKNGNDNIIVCNDGANSELNNENLIYTSSGETVSHKRPDHLNDKQKRSAIFQGNNKSRKRSKSNKGFKVTFTRENRESFNKKAKIKHERENDMCSNDCSVNFERVQCPDSVAPAPTVSSSYDVESEPHTKNSGSKSAKLYEVQTFHAKASGNKCGKSNGKRVRPRKAVLRMLIVIVVSFAICNLPFHIRKICISYLPNYEIGSTFSNISAPMTFLLMYANCAINPIIYAFMSKGFRSSLVDLVKCRFKRNFLRSQHSKSSL